MTHRRPTTTTTTTTTTTSTAVPFILTVSSAVTKYKNVKRLYFENKAQIEQMTGQIEHLQNAVANQRISASRTALDDSEYSTRFSRLNGAIQNMAFNIRKDWRLLPRWLQRFVNDDAPQTAKHEMTAVGRAVITRWIVDEVFCSVFHPGLDPVLSRSLKQIENGIRRGSYTLTSQEEYDALTAKVISWRMATLEGLAGQLSSPDADAVRAEFTRDATQRLLANLAQYLTDPPPAGIEGSASMILELAVGIAANMPLESRDVVIRYPLPGDTVEPGLMEPEKGALLPPLEVKAEEKGEESGEEKNGKERKKRKLFSPLWCFLRCKLCRADANFPSSERPQSREVGRLPRARGPWPPGPHQGAHLDPGLALPASMILPAAPLLPTLGWVAFEQGST